MDITTAALIDLTNAVRSISPAFQPAEVLAGLLTVDGAGSGLDADTLDGREASAFLEKSTGSAGNGRQIFVFSSPTVGAVAHDIFTWPAAAETNEGAVFLWWAGSEGDGTGGVGAVARNGGLFFADVPGGPQAQFVVEGNTLKVKRSLGGDFIFVGVLGLAVWGSI